MRVRDPSKMWYPWKLSMAPPPPCMAPPRPWSEKNYGYTYSLFWHTFMAVLLMYIIYHVNISTFVFISIFASNLFSCIVPLPDVVHSWAIDPGNSPIPLGITEHLSCHFLIDFPRPHIRKPASDTFHFQGRTTIKISLYRVNGDSINTFPLSIFLV